MKKISSSCEGLELVNDFANGKGTLAATSAILSMEEVGQASCNMVRHCVAEDTGKIDLFSLGARRECNYRHAISICG